MPWRESSVMEERLRFIARLLDGEGMSEVCRSFGISRKTGFKIYNRYKAEGLEALYDRSHRPVRYANQLPGQVERLAGVSTDGLAALGNAPDRGRGRLRPPALLTPTVAGRGQALIA